MVKGGIFGTYQPQPLSNQNKIGEKSQIHIQRERGHILTMQCCFTRFKITLLVSNVASDEVCM